MGRFEDSGWQQRLAQSETITEAQAMHLAHVDNWTVRLALARNPRLPASVIERLSHDGNRKVLVALAARNDLPDSVIITLATGTWIGVQAEILKKERLSEMVCWKIAGAGGTFGQSQLLRRADTSPEIVQYLSLCGSDVNVVETASADARLPADDLKMRIGEYAAAHRVSDGWARAGVKVSDWQEARLRGAARNPALGEDVMRQLEAQGDERLRTAVARNPMMPAAVLRRLVASPGHRTVVSGLLDNPSVGDELRFVLASDDMETRQLVAAHRLSSPRVKRWARRRGEGALDVRAGELERNWQGVRRRWTLVADQTPITGDSLVGGNAWFTGNSIAAWGWCEPSAGDGDWERWLLIHRAIKSCMPPDGAGEWVVLPLGFGGGGHLRIFGPWENRQLFMQTEWSVSVASKKVEMVTMVSRVQKGEMPALPDFAVEYASVGGALRARGLLWTERQLHVLWETLEGALAGWQQVDNWKHAKEIERAGTATPGPLSCTTAYMWPWFEHHLRATAMGGHEL